MKIEAKKTMIGGFVVTALLLCTAAVFIFGSGDLFKKTDDYVLFFENPTKGLSMGAPVTFNGVEVGLVKEIRLVEDLEKMAAYIPVIIELDPARWEMVGGEKFKSEKERMNFLISNGLRAKLDLQSIVTGKYLVSLGFSHDEPANFKGYMPDMIEIPTIQGKLHKLAQNIENLPLGELSHALLSTIEGIDQIVNSKETKALVPAIHSAVEKIKILAVNADQEMSRVGEQLEGTVAEYKVLAKHTDGHIGDLTGDYRTLARTLTSEITPLSRDIRDAARSISQGVESAQALIGQAEGLIDKDSPLMIDLNQALKELSGAARSIRVWADYLERHPEALIRGKGNK